MAYDFKQLQQKLTETEEWLSRELTAIQTGRATAMMLDGVRVDSYGSKVAINTLAQITTEDARTLRIVPWDTDTIQVLETALRDADLGLGIAVDGEGVRVSFPELTGETRERYVKMVHGKLEDARVALRQVRDHTWKEIQKMQKDGEMGEDDRERAKEHMEKIVQEVQKKIDEVAERKEQEIKG